MHATHYCMSQAWECMEYLYSNSFRNGGTRVLGSNVPTFGTYIHGLTWTYMYCSVLHYAFLLLSLYHSHEDHEA